MLPPNAAALADSVDRLLLPGTDTDGAERTRVLVDRAAPIARLGLALDEHDPALERAAGLDAVLLHRHWRVALHRLPPAVAVLACHAPLDLRLGLASTPELHRALGLHEVEPLGAPDGVPLAAVCVPDRPTTLGALRTRLQATFGGVEAEEPVHDEGHPVARVATARAMTPGLVRLAAAAGAAAYVTGQLRAPARAAAREGGVHVLAVGHRRSERWALRVLADLLRERWPELAVEVAEEDAGDLR